MRPLRCLIEVAGESLKCSFKALAIEAGFVERIQEKPRRPGTCAPLVEELNGTRFKRSLEALIGKFLDTHHKGGPSGGRELLDLVTEFVGLAARRLR
ncbi:MAG TPA: hypothetical protein VGJ20_28150 [Xanthobacteraceae bacterium]